MNMINKKEDRLKNLLSWNRNQDTSWAQEVSFRKTISPVAKIKVVWVRMSRIYSYKYWCTSYL